MFDEVLKFGSLIVDALVEYKQPVFVYIPPEAELRGGAWVVVDSTINPEMMEMFADPTARGGILEPAGICGVKYKEGALKGTALRLDKTLRQLKQHLAAGTKNKSMSAESRRQFEADVKKRERKLLPVYRQVAEHFADLHDRPGRMLAKGVISATVPWARARGFFYWRLRRRTAEIEAVSDAAGGRREGARARVCG